jgi:hypothetical protein
VDVDAQDHAEWARVMTGSSCREVAAFSALVSCAMTIALPYGKCVVDSRGGLGSGLAVEAIMVTRGGKRNARKEAIFSDGLWPALSKIRRYRAVESSPAAPADDAITPATLGEVDRARHDDAAGVVATRGELWLTYFEPATLGAELRAIGLKQAKTSAPMSCTRVGSDIGGSVRVPAHFYGIYGHKSSIGLNLHRALATRRGPAARAA